MEDASLLLSFLGCFSFLGTRRHDWLVKGRGGDETEGYGACLCF